MSKSDDLFYARLERRQAKTRARVERRDAFRKEYSDSVVVKNPNGTSTELVLLADKLHLH